MPDGIVSGDPQGTREEKTWIRTYLLFKRGQRQLRDRPKANTSEADVTRADF